MATVADIQWVRERIDPDEWPIFVTLQYATLPREAVDAAATARLDAHTDKRDALADLLEILDAQQAWNSESDATTGHSRSGPRYAERIKSLRAQTVEDTGGVGGGFVQIPITHAPTTTWDEYAREQ